MSLWPEAFLWPLLAEGRAPPPPCSLSVPQSGAAAWGPALTQGREGRGVTPVRSVTLLPCVWLPPSQFPDHSGNGRNVRVTSMVTFEVTVTTG